MMKLTCLIFFVCFSLNLYAKTGSVTGLEIPRFVSLKSSDVNIRVGPSVNYPIKLKYVFLLITFFNFKIPSLFQAITDGLTS